MKRTINNGVSWTVRLSIASVMLTALVFMFNATDADAFQNFGLAGQNCKACHTLFSGGTSNPTHMSHATSGTCGTCHAPGLTIPPPTANCAQCHLGQGLRQHHRNAGVHQCSGCHANPETPAPENTIPPGYAGTTFDPCDGSEERFASFTVSLDNDGDLLYDGNDPDCQPQPEVNCTDGLDNDGDGFVDCDDQDCAADPACLTPLMETNCTDVIDNDNDSFVDCADPDCSADPACQAPLVENCTDGTDNDGDGLIDCADPNCSADAACAPKVEICTDGKDNDGDGLIDCADPSCSADTACVPKVEICTDGKDNDGDGLIDCADPNCSADTACAPKVEICTDGKDNDGDGLIDCGDPNCSADPACFSGGTNHLGTTCLGCHANRSGLATCSTGNNHVARVGQQVWNETLVELGLTCSGTGGNNNVPPADHTDREDGIKHKPGKSTPFTNGCTACHGADLRGGAAPSCFSCHGTEWKEKAPTGGNNNVPPADHTEREDGIKHKPGKSTPYTNGCTTCHGADLRGGVAPSCFSCHGVEWKESSSVSNGNDQVEHDDEDKDSDKKKDNDSKKKKKNSKKSSKKKHKHS